MDTMTWTDDKIDVLNGKVDALDTRVGGLELKVDAIDKKVDAGFARAEIESVRTDERFKAVGERFAEVNRRLGAVEMDLKDGFAAVDAKLDSKFDALQRTLLQIGGGLIGTLIAGIVALIAMH
ncbi:MAG: hypothetical protein JST59_21945 [Actinobacteria bacterium]|nr:hypothetical protein [Actinomycetota bacterium]